jgi:hypothetical protein
MKYRRVGDKYIYFMTPNREQIINSPVWQACFSSLVLVKISKEVYQHNTKNIRYGPLFSLER